MKDFNRKRSLLAILILYPILLVANIKMELTAKIKATTDKTQGILTMVDTILMKGWKAAGMKFRFYRSITGANDFKPLHDEFGTFQVFDIEATPGIWYEYKVEVLEKGGTPFFLRPLEPVKGFRPPSKSIATQFNWVKPYQYKGNIYLDWDFSDEKGHLILPDSATYHIKYDTEAVQSWFSTLGLSSAAEIHRELETTQSRLRIKILPGMKKILFCARMAQNGGISRFYCIEFDLAELPEKKPGLAGVSPAKPNLGAPNTPSKGRFASVFGAAKSLKYDAYRAKKGNRLLHTTMRHARNPQRQKYIRKVC